MKVLNYFLSISLSVVFGNTAMAAVGASHETQSFEYGTVTQEERNEDDSPDEICIYREPFTAITVNV